MRVLIENVDRAILPAEGGFVCCAQKERTSYCKLAESPRRTLPPLITEA
jgi:hypothetical protein